MLSGIAMSVAWSVRSVPARGRRGDAAVSASSSSPSPSATGSGVEENAAAAEAAATAAASLREEDDRSASSGGIETSAGEGAAVARDRPESSAELDDASAWNRFEAGGSMLSRSAATGSIMGLLLVRPPAEST